MKFPTMGCCKPATRNYFKRELIINAVSLECPFKELMDEKANADILHRSLLLTYKRAHIARIVNMCCCDDLITSATQLVLSRFTFLLVRSNTMSSPAIFASNPQW